MDYDCSFFADGIARFCLRGFLDRGDGESCLMKCYGDLVSFVCGVDEVLSSGGELLLTFFCIPWWRCQILLLGLKGLYGLRGTNSSL